MIVHPQNELLAYEAVKSGELEIDQQGRIWRLKKRTYDRWTGGVKVTPCKRVRAEIANPAGYLQLRVMRDSKRACAAAHRVIWLHIHGPIPQGMTVNHRDGVKNNNHPDNLELATYSEQRVHAITVLGARHHDVKGAKHPKTKLSNADVLEIRRRRAAGEMVKAIAASFAMKPKAISAICNRTNWKHIP